LNIFSFPPFTPEAFLKTLFFIFHPQSL
jgi:hypothetical protein